MSNAAGRLRERVTLMCRRRGAAYTVFASVLLAMGLYLLARVGWITLVQATAGAGWQTAPGEVTAVSRSLLRGPKGAGNSTWRVAYRYEVGGQTFENDRCYVAYSYGFSGPNAPYFVGAKLTVYHHPTDPSRAALTMGFPFGAVVGRAVAGGFLVLLGGNAIRVGGGGK